MSFIWDEAKQIRFTGVLDWGVHLLGFVDLVESQLVLLELILFYFILQYAYAYTPFCAWLEIIENHFMVVPKFTLLMFMAVFILLCITCYIAGMSSTFQKLFSNTSYKSFKLGGDAEVEHELLMCKHRTRYHASL